MAAFRAEKIVSALPATLEPNTLYAVRTGAGFDLRISDSTGSIAHALNAPAPDTTAITQRLNRMQLDLWLKLGIYD